MHFRPALIPRILFGESNRYQTIVFAFCFAFGIAMIANAHTTADEVWFWYADLYNHGMLLYSQLHLVLQPLFPLETAWFMKLLGKGWLASKVPAVLHLAAYLLGILFIVRQSSLPDRQRAILFGAAFFLTVNSVAYRFDDYHVVAETFVLYSVGLLLKLHRSDTRESHFGLVALLGVLAGFAIETRLNDGAALLLASSIAIVYLLRKGRLIALVCFSTAAAVTVVIVVKLCGDSFSEYWTNSVFRTGGSKGGVGSILSSPLRLPLNALLLYRDHHRSIVLAALFIGACVIWVCFVRPAMLIKTRKAVTRAIVSVVLIAVPACFMYSHGLLDRIFLLSVAAIALLLIYAFGLITASRAVRFTLVPSRSSRWNRLEILLLVPLGQLVSASMSAAGRLDESYTPFALFVLLLPIASPIAVRERRQDFLLAAAVILLAFGFVHRVMEPLRWLNEVNQPMFVGRQWFHHPVYGPMIIESDMLAFIEPVCKAVNNSGSDEGFLSMPFSYANYFCAVPPWHGHVQTWYDISSVATIDSLREELRQAPPKWILYEKQPETLSIHEIVFNGGKPIPFRYLDQMIGQQIDDGSWKVVYKSSYGGAKDWTDRWLSQEWFLIQTRP